ADAILEAERHRREARVRMRPEGRRAHPVVIDQDEGRGVAVEHRVAELRRGEALANADGVAANGSSDIDHLRSPWGAIGAVTPEARRDARPAKSIDPAAGSYENVSVPAPI